MNIQRKAKNQKWNLITKKMGGRNQTNLQVSLMKNINYLIDRFKGYDPYDLAEASIRLPHSILAKLSFINKVSPVNFRPFLGIHKTDNSKANGIWLWAFLLSKKEDHHEEIEYLLDWIERNRSTEFEEFSMGFAFKMALSRYASGPGKTSLIISLFTVFPLIELYRQKRQDNVLEMILSFEKLLEEKWLKFESKDELWYSYLPNKKDEVFNATAKIGKFYSLLYSIKPDASIRDKIKKILNYLLEKRHADGSWSYSTKAGYVDNFHTAFILDSIHHMIGIIKDEKYNAAFEHSLKDYLGNCFDKGLQPLHFHKKHKPKDLRSRILTTEIRDCANAIILFSKLHMKKEASNVLMWTRENMFDSNKNYYYFYKNGLYTNRINFIRWQAWMALAISEYNLAFDEEI